jgi:hypothetical protein
MAKFKRSFKIEALNSKHGRKPVSGSMELIKMNKFLSCEVINVKQKAQPEIRFRP